MEKIGFIGCGNMGRSIAEAIFKDQNYKISIYSRNFERNKEFAKTIKATAYETLEELLTSSDYIILAVKPQVLPSLYEKLSKASKNIKWISIAAGVSLKVLKDKLNTKSVVRFMPNIAAKKQASVTAIAFPLEADPNFKQTSFKIAECFGKAFILEEKLFSAFIGISGSGIAYVFEFLHAMALGGTREGLSYSQSLDIAVSTLNSACSLLEKGVSPIDLMTKVTSAGGTTIEGIKTLHDGKFDSCVINAVHSASSKSIELEKKS